MMSSDDEIGMSDQNCEDEIAICMEETLRRKDVCSGGKYLINKIPAFIRKGKEEFYRPSVVSIGPMYYDDETLKAMQELKWTSLKYFLQHPLNDNPSLKHYIKFVKNKETIIGDCYEERINIPSQLFIQMIVLDAAFIIYLFLNNTDFFEIHKTKNKSNKLSLNNMPVPEKQQGLAPYVSKDLLLLENQLPYFVLQGFFDLAFGWLVEKPNYEFECIALLNIMDVSFPGFEATMASVIKVTGRMASVTDVEDSMASVINVEDFSCPDDPTAIKHLLHLLRMCCFRHADIRKKRLSLQTHQDDRVCSYPNTAKKLSDNGVKFEVIVTESPLDITFEKGKFKIPELVLDTDTEPYLRNLLYFEQCHYPKNSYINDYMLFFDKLIDTVEDVQVLQEARILKNHLGSDEDAIKFFNNVPRITVGVRNQFYYSEVSKKANKYASSSWNKSLALLKRRYFSHPWASISLIAATILFILTLLQTIAAYNE